MPLSTTNSPLRFRSQFSLASLFVLTTLVALGVWIWYQLPFPVEQWVLSLDGICLVGEPNPQAILSQPKNFREVIYYRRLSGGNRMQHGPYRGYDLQGNLLRSGYFRSGQRHGRFLDFVPGGQKVLEMTYVNGKLEGVCQSFDSSGARTSYETYLHGKRHGPSRSSDPDDELTIFENYEQDSRHGPFKYFDKADRVLVQGEFTHGAPSGEWTWYPDESGIVKIVGHWREGRADGRWQWLDTTGQPCLGADFCTGLVTHIEPPDLSPRIVEACVASTTHFPSSLLSDFRPLNSELPRASLGELASRVSMRFANQRPLDLSVLEPVGVSPSEPIPNDLQKEPLVLALAKTLKRHGRAYDLRYGRLIIDTASGVAAWRDPTGVMQIVPHSGSRLKNEWNRSSILDVVEMPLSYVLNYLSELHLTSIDPSAIPATAIQTSGDKFPVTLDTPVTLEACEPCFKDVLAILLNQVHCKASLRGQSLIIEPQ